MQKYWLLRIALLVTTLAPATQAATSSEAESLSPKHLTIGYIDLPPHTFPEKSGLPSAALNYFDMIAQDMGVEVEYIQYPLSRLVFLLDHQRLDAALFLAKSDAREKSFAYPAAPYFIAHPVFVVPSTSKLTSAQDIARQNNLKIVAWQGGFHSPTLANSNNTLIPLSGNAVAERGIELIIKGRFDAFFSPDRYSIDYNAKMHEQTDSIRQLPITGETIEIYTVFSKKSAPLYLKDYERSLKNISAKITYETLLTTLQMQIQRRLQQQNSPKIPQGTAHKETIPQ
jgi:polar amino acid transport system substrate-binding protein